MTNYEELFQKQMENPEFAKAFHEALLGRMKADRMENLSVQERAKRGSWEKFQRVLKKVPNVEPEEYDKL